MRGGIMRECTRVILADNSMEKRKIGKSFMPGVSGNPGGAPKGKRISTWMAELGDKDPKDWPKEKGKLPANARIAMARILKSMGEEGERSTEIILDRVEGPMKQIVESRIIELTESPQEILKAMQNDTAPGTAPGTGTETKYK
jgi:hypothetical protein